MRGGVVVILEKHNKKYIKNTQKGAQKVDKLFLKKDLVTGITLTQDGVLAYIALRTIMDESITYYIIKRRQRIVYL